NNAHEWYCALVTIGLSCIGGTGYDRWAFLLFSILLVAGFSLLRSLAERSYVGLPLLVSSPLLIQQALFPLPASSEFCASLLAVYVYRIVISRAVDIAALARDMHLGVAVLRLGRRAEGLGELADRARVFSQSLGRRS